MNPMIQWNFSFQLHSSNLDIALCYFVSTYSFRQIQIHCLNTQTGWFAVCWPWTPSESSSIIFTLLFHITYLLIYHGMSVRNGERYHVNIGKTERYKDSAVPFLQRLLNKDIKDKKDNLKRLINHVKVSKKIERSEIENSRVKYICNVDVIT